MLWWLFYASCHGKGMQDAAGAWVRSRVARAILLGQEIKSVRAFFTYCLMHLSTRAMGNNPSGAFTSNRYWYLLEDNELAVYRARLPEVSPLKSCWLDSILMHLSRRYAHGPGLASTTTFGPPTKKVLSGAGGWDASASSAPRKDLKNV